MKSKADMIQKFLAAKPKGIPQKPFDPKKHPNRDYRGEKNGKRI